jgi:uncharacterized protein YpmB
MVEKLIKGRVIKIAYLLTVFVYLVGCSKAPKENKIQVVKETSDAKDIVKIDKKIITEGINPFYSLEGLNVKENRNQIPLTLSKDKKYVYYMRPSIAKPKADEYTVIKGEDLRKVDIIKEQVETGSAKQVASYVPFVSSVKWSREGSGVAFLGGDTLTIYNDVENKLIQSFKGAGGGITSFGWSYDCKKIYTEGENLINTGIYYLDSKKYINSYETKETLFYKGNLDDQSLYATERTGDDNYNTVIVDKDNKIIGRFDSSGRFRDAYKTSFIQIGKNNFGLEYYADINGDAAGKVLSKDYINDVKFIYGGGIAYITPNTDPEENNFYLYIVDKNGNELKKLLVSGSTIMVLPDGKAGYIGGSEIERVDLINYTVERHSKEGETKDKEGILKTLRGAMDVIYKYEINKTKDMDRASKYFINSSNPEQWAYTDVTNMFKEDVELISKSSDYSINLMLKALSLSSGRATASISGTVINSVGSGMGIGNIIELIKKDERWYVTGLSTFPSSKQHSEVKSKVEALIKQAQQGNTFNGQLRGKEVQIGQIQFWKMSEPHLAENIEYANYCKVYLKVKEDGKEVLYKLVLDKNNQGEWKGSVLSKDNLSKLF